jgi:ribonuclease Z
MRNLRKGEDFINNLGKVYKNNELTFNPKKSHIYAFCSDNRIKDSFFKKLKNVTVLYHESTFLHTELERAKKTFHSTAKEAAELALRINPNVLILSHFSARYTSLNPILEEAKKVFTNSILADEKLIINFSNIKE